MVEDVRNVEKAMGIVDYSLNYRKSTNRRFARSLFVVQDVKKGEVLTSDNVRSIRPSNGLSPKLLPRIIGKRAALDVQAGTPLEYGHVIW